MISPWPDARNPKPVPTADEIAFRTAHIIIA
jgi:hypothetical protein